MKSENLSSRKGSLYGLSNMWTKTLYRRNLLLAFVAFMAYFSCTILPLILSFNNFNSVSDYFVMVMSGEINFVPVVAITYPIVLSVMLFDYLHSSASATGIHSFPLTRGRLFRSTLATGAVLLLAPIAVTAVLFFVFGRIMPAPPVTERAISEEFNVIIPVTLFSVKNCVRWFIDTSVGTLFVFAISNLAGIVAGKNIIHALLAYLLNSIIAIVCLLCDMYARTFILGSDGTPLTEFAQKTNPFLWYATERNSFLSAEHAPMMLAFAGIAIFITVLTGLLYKEIKLEREQDATVFPVVSDLLVIFCSFCVMSLFGIISAEITPADEHAVYSLVPFLLGCLIGGIPAFIVFRMIADSSVRIFKPRTLVNFAAFALVTCVVFAFTCFDITGQADKVPEASDVTKAEIETLDPFDTEIILQNDNSKADVTALHKAILKHKDKAIRENYDYDTYIHVKIVYHLKNGGVMKRSYNIDAARLEDVREAAKKLASEEEYNNKIETYLRKVILNAAGASISTSRGDVNISEEDIRPLVMAYFKDYKANGTGYYYKLKQVNITGDTDIDYTHNKVGCINVSPTNPDKVGEDLYLTASFGEKDRHVHRFLKKYGYDEKIEKAEKLYGENSID